MGLRRVVGVILTIAAVYLLWQAIVPYSAAYEFWIRFGPAGMLALNSWWFATYGLTTIVAVGLLIFGVCLIRRKE